MAKCPKCGGEMRSGEIFAQITTSMSQAATGFGMIHLPGVGVPSGDMTKGESVIWKEKTGRKTGFLIKSDEEKIMKVTGQRCTLCGYVEIFAQE